jgi:hypothetical protein
MIADSLSLRALISASTFSYEELCF